MSEKNTVESQLRTLKMAVVILLVISVGQSIFIYRLHTKRDLKVESITVSRSAKFLGPGIEVGDAESTAFLSKNELKFKRGEVAEGSFQADSLRLRSDKTSFDLNLMPDMGAMKLETAKGWLEWSASGLGARMKQGFHGHESFVSLESFEKKSLMTIVGPKTKTITTKGGL